MDEGAIQFGDYKVRREEDRRRMAKRRLLKIAAAARHNRSASQTRPHNAGFASRWLLAAAQWLVELF